MVLLLALAALVVAAPLLGPVVAGRGAWRVWHPRLALAVWHGLVVVSVGGALALVVLTLRDVDALAQARASTVAVVLVLGVWVAMFALGGAVALLLAHGEPVVRDDLDHRRDLRTVLTGGGFEVHAYRDVDVRIVRADRPHAVSFRAPEPTIVLTDGLTRLLDGRQLRAILEHERAHLVGHHHLALRVADLHAQILPWRGARGLRDATRLLVELIADDAAVAACGPAPLAAALREIGRATGEAAMLERATRVECVRRRRAGLVRRPARAA